MAKGSMAVMRQVIPHEKDALPTDLIASDCV